MQGTNLSLSPFTFGLLQSLKVVAFPMFALFLQLVGKLCDTCVFTLLF